MNGPVEEIRRLRAQLAQKDQDLAELRGLVKAHLEATGEDPELTVKLEHAAFERGYYHGDEDGWRRGVEHALMEVDRAHWTVMRTIIAARCARWECITALFPSERLRTRSSPWPRRMASCSRNGGGTSTTRSIPRPRPRTGARHKGSSQRCASSPQKNEAQKKRQAK